MARYCSQIGFGRNCPDRCQPVVSFRVTRVAVPQREGIAFRGVEATSTQRYLLGDRGYDADWFRHALIERGITPCIPSRTNRKVPIPHDRALYRQRHRVENMFGKIKDWRRIHTCYDRCAHTFMSAICIAATVIFWINQ